MLCRSVEPHYQTFRLCLRVVRMLKLSSTQMRPASVMQAQSFRQELDRFLCEDAPGHAALCATDRAARVETSIAAAHGSGLYSEQALALWCLPDARLPLRWPEHPGLSAVLADRTCAEPERLARLRGAVGGQPVRWGYHVAPTVLVRQPDGTCRDMVIDPSLRPNPMTVPEWEAIMGGAAVSATSGPDIFFRDVRGRQFTYDGPANRRLETNAAFAAHRAARDG